MILSQDCSQDCSKCPENKELDDLINSYKAKLIVAMDKNIEDDESDLLMKNLYENKKN